MHLLKFTILSLQGVNKDRAGAEPDSQEIRRDLEMGYIPVQSLLVVDFELDLASLDVSEADDLIASRDDKHADDFVILIKDLAQGDVGAASHKSSVDILLNVL